jgi:hypothetical protein
MIVTFAPYSPSSHNSAFDRVTAALDPVVAPLGLAAGQVGGGDGRGQVILGCGDVDRSDGSCLDLVIDLEATPDWRITDVRSWGDPSDRWHLEFDAQGELDA